MDIQVGDRIVLKKPHPCGSKEWGGVKDWSRLPIEMCRVRTSDHDTPQTGGKKY